MKPLYLEISLKEIEERAEKLFERQFNCDLCPRNCKVDRSKNVGFCKTGIDVRIASYNLHFGEEPPITGYNGSGTIFFSGCNLLCLFCQNYPISHLNSGNIYSFEELAEIMIKLQNEGAHNINLVTPTHVLPQFLKGLVIAIRKGLRIPIVWNSSGYEKKEVIEDLDGIVDIYMPDFKYAEEELSFKLSRAKDYFYWAKDAIKEMIRQVGNLVMDEDGIALRGVLIRHLVLPGNVSNSKKVLKFIRDNFGKDVYLSLMSQYHPAYKTVNMPPFDRYIKGSEYREVLNYAIEIGLTNGYRQGVPL
ncbi:MAG: radical SAM protein [Caldiserica bacterium]|nr:MAG: radical SAM protein [Caldisericota bacterium]